MNPVRDKNERKHSGGKGKTPVNTGLSRELKNKKRWVKKKGNKNESRFVTKTRKKNKESVRDIPPQAPHFATVCAS